MSAPAASHGRALLFEVLDRELEVCECCDEVLRTGIAGAGSRRAASARSLIIAARLARPILRIPFSLRCEGRSSFPFTTKGRAGQFSCPDGKWPWQLTHLGAALHGSSSVACFASPHMPQRACRTQRRISQYPWQPSWWCVILRDFSTFRARFDTPKS